MTAKFKHAQHGRDHRLRGSDPTPFIVRMPNIHFRQNLNGVTFSHTTTDTDKLSFGTLLLPPIDHGGTVDTDVFDITGGGPWDHVPILVPGLYYAEARCSWFRDWGKFRINLQYTHSNGESFPISDSWGSTDSMPSEPGVEFTPIGTEAHSQTAVRRGGFLLIDEYTFASGGTMSLFATTTNSDTVDHTFNNTTNIGGCTLFVVQLSTSAHSNPPWESDA